MKFQDELESGAKKRSSGISIQEEVCRFREKLMQKVSVFTEVIQFFFLPAQSKNRPYFISF